MALLVLAVSNGGAATVYWDINGTTAGAGGSAPTATWDASSTFWNALADGTGAVAAWNGGDIAEFAAGTDALATYTVNVSGTQLIGGLRFGEGRVTLNGGTLQLGGAAAFDVAANLIATVNSTVTGGFSLNKTGAGTLTLGGLNTYSGGTTLSGGTTRIWHGSNLGAVAGGLSLAGGTLQTGNVTLNRSVTVSSDSSIDVARNSTASIDSALLGSAALTKRGNGELRLNANNSGFTGSLNVASGIVRMRTSITGGVTNFDPSLNAATGYNVGTSAQLILDNAVATSTAPVVNMLSDTAPITMSGGRLTFVGNNATGTFTETAGNVSITDRYSSITVTRTATASGVVLDLGTLSRSGNGTVSFVNSGGTLGATGSNPRITFRTVPTLNDGIIGGWAVVNGNDFAGYVGTGGSGDQGVGALGGTGFPSYNTHTAGTIISAAATDNVAFSAGSGTFATLGTLTINSLKMTATASTPVLAQTSGTTLTIDSGGIITPGNFTKTIGTSGAFLKANGGALYVHNDTNTLTINSTIQNGDVAMALIKDQSGGLTLGAGASSTYSGGTYVNGGTLTTGTTAARNYLGTGPVFVNSASLVLQRNGATTSTSGYTITNGGMVTLTNNITYNSTGDRFNFGAGSVLNANSAAANQGMNSLTRVSTLTAASQVILAPDSILAYSAVLTGAFDLANQSVKTLGTNADLYFGLGVAGTTGSVAIGNGTPFKGLSTDRTARTWTLGTLDVAAGTSDIFLQGLIVPDSSGSTTTPVTLTLGNGATAGGFTINPAGTNAFNARIIGTVALDDDSSVYGSGSAPMTFVVEPGATLEAARATSLGSGAGIASVRVLNGGTLQQNSTNNVGSELNGNVTIEGGGRFLAQIGNGLTGSGTITFEPGSILHITSATGWSGAQAAATVVPDSAVVRLGVAAFGTTTQPLLTQPSFSGAGIYEIVGTAGPANPTTAGTTILNLNNGGIITNDNTDRTWTAAANGVIVVGAGGGVIAGSTGTRFTMANAINLGGNALTIGSNATIDGNNKLGEVSLSGAVGTTGGQISVLGGVALRIGAANILADALTVNLGANSQLNVDNAETINMLTGPASASVIGDSALSLADTGNYNLDVALKGTTTGFNLIKLGAGTMTLTNPASTGLGVIQVREGTIRFGAGANIGTTYTLTANSTLAGTATIDLNGTNQTAAALNLQGSTTTSAPVITGAGSNLTLGGTVTYTSTNNPLGGVISVSTLTLGAANRTFNVGNSTSAVDDLTLSSGTTLQGDAGVGIIKTGAGTLRIDGTNNLTGSLDVQAGSITGSLGAANLLLNGGTYESSGTFARGLGTGANQVQWAANANGGFAARGGPLTVTLAGAPNPLVWDSTANFVTGTGQLLFNSVSADDVVTFTHNIDLNSTGSAVTRTVQVLDNTSLTTDKAVLSGVLSNSGAAGSFTKSGAGVLELSGANTFTGNVTVSAGTLQFSTVSNTGGAASNLGQGSDLSVGAAVLSFIGGTSQVTNRPVILTGGTSSTITPGAASTLDASGTGGASITYNGPFTVGANSLNLAGTGMGILASAVVQSGTTADLNKMGSGTWRIDVAPTIIDNLIVNEGLLIFNALDTFTGDDLFIRTATLKLNINGALTSSMDDLNISTETASGGILDINGTTGSSTTDVIIGANPANQPAAPALSGSLIDSLGGGSFATATLNIRNGTVSANVVTTSTVTLGNVFSADTGGVNTTSGTISGNLTLSGGSSLSLFDGLISGSVTWGTGTLAKHSTGTVTISGNNTVTGAGASTLNGGVLALNYATNTGTKLSAAGLTMSGGTLQLNGHATTAVTENVGNLTIGSAADPGGAKVEINPAGASTTLQVGTITRNLGGTLRYHPASASAHLTTSATNTAGALLGGWATYQLGSGPTLFAGVSGGEIVGVTSTAADNVALWTNGTDVTDSTGFFGTTATGASINSLRFNAASAAPVTVGAGNILNIASGGILITSNVTGGNPGITGGRLTAGTVNDVIVTHDGSSTFTLGSTLMGSISVTKAGSGTMVLNNTANTSVGGLRVTGGTVRLTGGGAWGDIAPVILDSSGNVLLDVVDSETIGALSGGDASNFKGMAIQIADTKALTINQTAAGTFYGNISAASGSATLNRFSSGQLTLTDSIVDLGPSGVINIGGGRLTLDINGNNNMLTQVVAGTTINIGPSSSFFIEHNGISTGGIAAGRVADNVAINLNSAGSTTDSILFRHDQDGSITEVVGTVTLASGVNSIRVDASSTGTSAVATFRATALNRLDQSTLVIRGTNIQKTANPRAQFQVTALFPGFGTGTTTSLPVVPWAIGPSAGGSAGVGDSFVTTAGTANAQWRPLDLATEYAIVTDTTTWGTAASTNNTRVTATVTGAASAKTLRSLLMETAAGVVDLTGDGAGALTVDSGGFLFSGTGSSTISGFTGIGVNASVNEYVFHVMGSTATVTPPLTTVGGKITKSGPGVLILSGTSTALGATTVTTINEGTLQIADLDNIGGNAGGILFAGGTLRLDATTYSGDDLSTRTITMLPGGGTIDTNGNSLAFANSIGNNGLGGFTKAGVGTLTLNAAATYQGATTVNGGTLLYGIAGAVPSTSALNLGNGTLDTAGFASTLGGFNLTGNGTLAGTSTLAFSGNGQMDGGASRTLTVNNASTSFNGGLFTLVSTGTTARTLTINGTGNVNIAGPIADGTAAGSLTYAGSGTLTSASSNVYTGTTTIDSGTLTFTADQNLAGAVRFGNAMTVLTTGTLNLSNANATFGGAFTVQTNSVTPNIVTIGTGKTLTVNNSFSITNNTNGATTALTMAGGGAFVVNGATFAVGLNAGGTNITSKASLDMTGLSSFTANLTGALNVQQQGDNGSANAASMLLSNTANNITAASLGVGVSSTGSINTLGLGAGTNVIHVNTVNIGTGGRDGGTVSFGANATGTLVLRDTAGTGRVAFNMGTGSASTGIGTSNVFDVTGHNADLLLGAVNIGTQAGRTSALNNTFSFDTGTLDMTSLTLGSKGSTGATLTTATFNIGGGTVLSGPIVMAATTTATGNVIANLNVTGGNITLSGSITKAGGVGTDVANFTLNGATAVMDFGGNTLGGTGAAALDNVTIAAGTIKNLGEFNGGADLVKTTAGTLTMDGVNTYTGNTMLEQGIIIAAGGGNNRLSQTAFLVGSGTNSGVLQLGTAAGASNQTFTSLATSGTGTSNAIVGGSAAFSTLTINQSINTTFNGAVGGAGANQNNLNLVKNGAGEFVIAGPRTYTGTTAVNGGKVFIDGYAGPTATLAGLTLGNGTEFALRGSSPSNHVVYGFSGTGNVITVGSTTGATLGFALDGAFNTQYNLLTGQTMTVNGTLTTAIYVNSAPNAGQQYVLINGADDGSIFGSGSFNLNPVVFNGGSFTYALSQVTAGAGEKWVLIPSAQAAAADVWWKGDLTGIATGVWSASLTSGTGFPTNWDDSQSGGVDALVPPDSGSIVHFSATGAANFATTLGANLTIQELIFHSGGNAISIGSSGGTNTLTLGNTIDASGMSMLAGAPNVSFSANIALAQSQAWNIADNTATFTMSGGLSGAGPLNINNNGVSTGTLVFTGVNGLATHSGGTNLVTGRIILEGGADDRLPVNGALTMGNATLGAVLQLGDAVNGASNNAIGSLNTGAATTNSIVGGGATVSTLSINQTTAGAFNGTIGGAGTNQNNVAITKNGPATLVLNGVGSYVGATTITQGMLQLGAAGSVTQSASLAINAVAGTTATFDVNSRTAVLTGGITLGGADALAKAQILDTGANGLITLGGNVVFDATNNPLGASIASGLNLGAATRTFTANDSSSAAIDLTLTGNISTDGASTASGVGMTVDGNGSGLITGNVFLSNGTTNGDNADFTKNGTGTWTLQGTVTVGDIALINAGTFNINSGGSVVFNPTPGNSSPDFVMDSSAATVNLNTANAIVGNGNTNIIYVRDGGTLNINAAGAIGSSIEELRLGDDSQGIGNVVVNADVTVPILTVGFNSSGEVGNVTGAGTISGLNTINLDNGMVSANLAGTGNIDKDSLSVTLSGNNSLTGTTLVREGTLTLDFATNNLADSKIGTGNLTMGTTTTNDTTAQLTLSSNSTAGSLQTVANLVSAGGPSQISLVSNGSQQMVLRVTGTLSRTAGSLNLVTPANTRVEYTGATTNTNGIVGGWMTLNDRDFVTISGGQLQAATYTAQNNASLWTSNANITSSGGGFTGTVSPICNTINSLRFDGAGVSTITVGGTMILSSGGILETSSVGANASTITGGSIVSGTGAFVFHQNNTASTMTIASNLIGGSTITKNGAGTLLLSGTNVTGAVSIDEGILRVSGGNAISDTAAVNIRSVTGAGLELVAGAANSETIGNLGGDVTAAQIIIGTGATLTFNQTSTGSFAGVISGAGNLTKNGTATWTVSGDASLSGTLTVNAGRITMSGASGAINDTIAYVLNGGELHSLQDQSANENRIRDASPITLNNTGAGSGLMVENTYSTTAGARTETVGVITLGFGANTITATPTNNNTATTAEILAANILQGSNHSTLLVRGLALGDAGTARKGMIRSTAAITNIGGGGAAGSTNISIVPWMIGDRSGSTTFGNTFVTYINATQGLRPLLPTEYTTNAAGFNALTNGAASTNNMRFDTNPGATLTSTATAINSLVLDATGNIAVTGPANSIEITSGAILAANTGNHSLGGFSGITTGGGRDYIVSVTTAASTFTIDSALTSTVPFVKSGAGTVRLTNASNVFTDTYLNQGTLQTSSLSRLGTGTINFYGGGLKLEAGWTDDLSTRTLNIGSGGGAIDFSLVTAGATMANGIDDATPSAADSLNIFTRSSATGSIGLLTIQGASTYTGTTIFRNSGVSLSGTAGHSVVLNGATNAALNGNIELGDQTNVNNNFDVVLALGAGEQIVDTATMTFRGASGENAYFKLMGFNETIAGISDTTANGVIENTENNEAGVATNGKLTVNSSADFSYNGFLRNRGSGSNAFLLEFEKQGTGTQTLSGTNIIYTGDTTISGGTLRLTDTTAFNSNVINNGILDLNRTTGTWTLAKNISGSGVVMKSGAGIVVLSGTNTYTGETRIEQGTLSISTSGHLGDESAGTNTIRIANNAVLQSTGANVDLGPNRVITLAGTGGTIEVTGTNTLTQSSTIVGDACQVLTKTGSGRLVLSNGGNALTSPIQVNGGILQVGVSGGGVSGSGPITVGSGATLAGSGGIGGSVTLGAGSVLQTGDVTTVGTAATTVTANGTLNVAGGLITESSSTVLLTLTGSTNSTVDSTWGGNAVGSAGWIAYVTAYNNQAGDHDRLIIGGATTLAAGTEFIIQAGGGFTAMEGQIFNLIDWLGVSGFAVGAAVRDGSTDGGANDDLDLPNISSSGLAWDVSLFQSHGIVAVVPEPGRAMLLLLGLGLAFARRRR